LQDRRRACRRKRSYTVIIVQTGTRERTMAGMTKAQFAQEYKKPGSVKGGTPNFDWVGLLANDLSQRKVPFTVKEIVTETKMPKGYVYRHLSDWTERGDLAKVKYGGANHYMPIEAVEPVKE